MPPNKQQQKYLLPSRAPSDVIGRVDAEGYEERDWTWWAGRVGRLDGLPEMTMLRVC